MKMVKVYVTKHALTKGPFEVDAEILFNGSMASYKIQGYRNSAHGKDFWLTEKEALIDCENRRLQKLKSLDKQKKKLESMTFDIGKTKAP